jgi:hypothetical protein
MLMNCSDNAQRNFHANRQERLGTFESDSGKRSRSRKNDRIAVIINAKISNSINERIDFIFLIKL